MSLSSSCCAVRWYVVLVHYVRQFAINMPHTIPPKNSLKHYTATLTPYLSCWWFFVYAGVSRTNGAWKSEMRFSDFCKLVVCKRCFSFWLHAGCFGLHQCMPVIALNHTCVLRIIHWQTGIPWKAPMNILAIFVWLINQPLPYPHEKLRRNNPPYHRTSNPSPSPRRLRRRVLCYPWRKRGH